VNPVDKRRVGAAFSRSADAYDAHAEVQVRVRERALGLAAAVAPAAGRVLDVGAGTGALLARLAAERPALLAAAVDLAPGMCARARVAAPRAALAAADAEALPFRAGVFDLVVSTSTLQWLPRLEPSLAEMRRVLAPGGAVCVALFGERTLHELRRAWRSAANAARASDGRAAGTHRFASHAALESALAAAGLQPAAVHEEELVEWHADARAVLRALKALGASSAVPGRAGLGGRRVTLEMLRRYEEAHAGPAGVPATYHVLYAVARAAVTARRSPPSPRAPSSGPAAPSRAGTGS